jgi:nicotinamidase-related amidase
VVRFEKLEFSAVDAAGFVAPFDALTADGRDEWIVCGMETHICVWLSARGLRHKGAKVAVVADAVASRSAEHRQLGLGLCEGAGCAIVPAETVVFDWLGKAGSDDFKALSRLIR